MKKIFLGILLIAIHFSSFSQSQWTIDKAHSSIRFSITHMLISEVEGEFKSYEGTVTSSNPDFTDIQINFTVDVNSINTSNETRDNHLKSDDFFNAEQYPKITFKSTSVKKISDKKYELEGDLAMRDVTKSVKFDVTYNGTINASGKSRAGFKATTTINRLDYNLKWNKMTETGGAVASEDVNIIVNMEITKQN